MSDTIKKETMDIVNAHLVAISSDKKFLGKAKSVVNRILGSMLYARGEDEQIAQDAVQHVLTKLMEAMQKGTSRRFGDSNLGENTVNRSDVEAYLMVGVTNYCNTRAKRWSLDRSAVSKRDQDIGDSAGFGSSPGDGNASNKINSGLANVAVRARQPIYSDSPTGADFWDQNIHTEFDDGDSEADRIGKLLVERGLSEEEIDLINSVLSGTTFVELAQESGGTSDKYRKKYERALKKANLNL